MRIGKKICNSNVSNKKAILDKICTKDGSNNILSGNKIYTQEGSNIVLKRGQNMYLNKNINKNNIKNSEFKCGVSKAFNSINEFAFSD